MTGQPGHRTMEMNGRSTMSYLVCTPCVPLFMLILIGLEAKGFFRPPGETWDHFRCTVEPSPGHIRCRNLDLQTSPWVQRRRRITSWIAPRSSANPPPPPVAPGHALLSTLPHFSPLATLRPKKTAPRGVAASTLPPTGTCQRRRKYPKKVVLVLGKSGFSFWF